MKEINSNAIRDFYNRHPACWAEDRFSQMTTKFIDAFVNSVLFNFSADSLVLNAGCGGKQYKTSAKQVLLDIAENTLTNVPNGVVGDIADMPFPREMFDCVICVGTVLNYCNAEKAISEIARVSRQKALLIIEYERSESGFIDERHRGDDVLEFRHKYFSEDHINLLYSDRFVEQLLDSNGYTPVRSQLFNATIPWAERYVPESISFKMTSLELHFLRQFILSTSD